MTNQPNNTRLTPEEKALARFPPFILFSGKDAFDDNREVWKDGYQFAFSESQDRIAELERENEKWPVTVNELHQTFSDNVTLMARENETLMGLLEKVYRDERWMNYKAAGMPEKYIDDHAESDWQSYCKEHNLTSPPTDTPPLP